MASEIGYRYLKTFQLGTVIYDLTVKFCNRYYCGRDNLRIREQMVHAGRSGKQNIAEGYMEKSLKSYIYLLGVSRASFGELLEDYLDYARQWKVPVWNKDDPRAREFRSSRYLGGVGSGMAGISGIGNDSAGSFPAPDTPDIPDSPEVAVNLMITLLNQETYMLDRQIAALEKKFVVEGGYTENLFKQRMEQRKKDEQKV